MPTPSDDTTLPPEAPPAESHALLQAEAAQRELVERARVLAEHAGHELEFFQMVGITQDLRIEGGITVVLGAITSTLVEASSIECRTCGHSILDSDVGSLIV